MRTPTNSQVAAALERVAELLDAQRASPFRVQAFRTGAACVRAMTRPVAEVLDTVGTEGLERLPGIGKTLAEAIRQLVRTGRYGMLSRLDGEVAPEEVLTTIPGIGPKMARRLHEELGVASLEALEGAARDGRLEKLKGFGPRRMRLVREVLAARRGAASAELKAAPTVEPPPVALLLEVDADYRDHASRGLLQAPSSFAAPQLRVVREGYGFTAHYSRTERARTLGREHDWVVITWDHEGGSDRSTVVTEHRGLLAGHRVVRGREAECAELHGARLEVWLADGDSQDDATQEELFPDAGLMH